MTTRQFIEKAIGGGWKYFDRIPFELTGSWTVVDDGGEFLPVDHSAFFVDPLAWQAVGKVENWDINTYSKEIMELVENEDGSNKYKAFMHRMVDFICDGGTIEEFIATL